MINKFWKWLTLFAYQQIKEDPIINIGIPGIRDKDNPCDLYQPKKKKIPFADCESDGHYLCKKCAYYNPEE